MLSASAPVLALALVCQTEALTLERAIETALQQSADVIRAREDVLIADVERLRALGAALPTINLSSAYNQLFYVDHVTEARSGTYGEFVDVFGAADQSNFNLSLSGRQLIYDGGRVWAVIARVDDIRALREALLRAVEANLRLLVVRRFYDLAKASRGVETFSVQVKLAEEQLQRALEGLQTGRGKQNDVAQAERNLAQDRVTLARRLFTESTRARFVNLALGREPDILFRLVIPPEVETTTVTLQPIVIPRTEVLLEDAVKMRSEVVASSANLAFLEKNLEIRRADYFPVIGFNATYLKSSRRPDRVFADPTENYLAIFGIDLRWNLFAGRATDAAVEEGEIDLRKARVIHADLLRNVRAEVLEKIEQLRLLAQVFGLNRSATRAAEQAVSLLTKAYRENKATLLELRDAEFRLITARDAIFEARFDLEVAIEELRRAVGGEVLDRVGVPVQEIR